ncbi:hypothetical protein [Agrobacterium rosae]|uniref:hypothetical protein n=1 Tax=Agrobacterium rosae TaxID=1972867 RepID=UPI0031B7EB62
MGNRTNGSNTALKELVSLHGSDRFKREILHLCRSSSECAYWESKLQFQYDVLLDDTFFNDMIMCRISGRHVKNLGMYKYACELIGTGDRNDERSSL